MNTQEQGAKIREIANRLDVKPQWLDALINFETAGTYSTTIPNLAAASSARGLIQLTDDPARELGYRDSLQAVMSNQGFAEQMENIVYPYLKRWGPYPTKQSLYMGVFYPDYRYVNPSTRFPQKIIEANRSKDGVARIKTVQDYIDFVDRRIKKDALRVNPMVPPVALALLAVGGIAYYLIKRRGKR